MKLAYDLLFFIFAVFSIPKFLVRLNQSSQPRQMIKERFGRFDEVFCSKFAGKNVVWLHAVSVGEVMALRQWVQLFEKQHPDWFLAFSVTTPTGHSVAKRFTSPRVVVFHAPFDFSFVVKHLLKLVRPKLILLMETEIWPNLISEARAARVPIGIINGRISLRAMTRYRIVKSWARAMMEKLSFCLVQSERDRQHFLELGMADDKLVNAGNMKYDQVPLRDGAASAFVRLLRETSSESRVLMGGSTSGAEESYLLEAFCKLRVSIPDLRLVLAPRHVERIPAVVREVQKFLLPVKRLSSPDLSGDFDVLVVDQMGVLAELYEVADVVFVGGSLAQRGGQNPIEAADCQKPIVHGPHVFNFHEVYRILDACGGALQVESKEELYEKLNFLLERSDIRNQMGTDALKSVQKMRGATARTMEFVENQIRSAHPLLSKV